MSIPVCKFYASKTCRFGKNCRYLHPHNLRPPLKGPETSREENTEHTGETANSVSPVIQTTLLSAEGECLNGEQNEVLLSKTNLEHQDRSSKAHSFNPSLQNKNEKKTFKPATRTICYFFQRHGNCRYGEECRFLHSSSIHKPSKPTERLRNVGKYGEVPPRFRKSGDNENDVRTSDINPQDGIDVRSNTDYDQIKEGQLKDEGRKQKYAARRVCPFFKSERCNRGDKCRFMHLKEETAESQSSKPSQSDDETKHFGVKEGSNRRTELKDATLGQKQGDINRPVVVKQVLTLAELEKTDILNLRNSEVNTIKKRFPHDKIIITEETESKFSARIVFSPTDPDWAFDMRDFELLITLPSDYPKEMMYIVLPTDQNLPETVRRFLEISIKEWLDNKADQLAKEGKVELVFRPFLLWLDRNIEDITMEALKQFKRELVAKAAGMEFIPAEKLQARLKEHSEVSVDSENQLQDESSDESDGSIEGSDDSSDDDGDDDVVPQTYNTDPEKKGTEIELRHLQLRENASALLFEKLKIVLQCGRCKNHCDILVSPGKVMSIKCEKCRQNQFVHFRPALLHQFSSVAGYLDLDGCQAFDLIFQECQVAVTCLACSKQTRLNGFVTGHMVDGWCQACNARFKLATEAVKFVQLAPSDINTSVNKVVDVASSKQKKPPKDPAIKEGLPLPEFGTCKHYKHSYRWLRFPCCGKAYPCDICHDKKENHEMVFATRMICGHCCKEQNFSATRPCNACGQHLTKIRTAHWEGGSGCRDKISMSKNDQQKYKNMNKTVSNHHKKVQTGSQKKTTKLRHS